MAERLKVAIMVKANDNEDQERVIVTLTFMRDINRVNESLIVDLCALERNAFGSKN